uniref:Uncharacterized protein n=1 Tax=Chelonoidis abingdonii TaxID=106734 RepID=A0A8C0G365_CHEAB
AGLANRNSHWLWFAAPGQWGLREAATRIPRPTPLPQVNKPSRPARGHVHFVPTTQILPLKKAWENDEEFLSLPPRIKELEGLARYLSDLSLTKGRLGHDQVQQDLPCYSGSRSHLLSELVEDQGSIKNKYGIQGSEDCVLCHACSSQKPSTENINLSSQDHRESVSRLGMPSIRDMLDGRYLGALESEGQDLTKGKDQQKESLVQCIKLFPSWASSSAWPGPLIALCLQVSLSLPVWGTGDQGIRVRH